MTFDEIENYIRMRISSLSPKIREKFTYQFVLGDGIDGRKKIEQFANTTMARPPVITFFLEVLEKHNFLPENLDGLIKHELTHVLGFNEESAHIKELESWKNA